MEDHKYGTWRIMCILWLENFSSNIMKNLLISPFMGNSLFKSTTDLIVGQRQVSESQSTPQVTSELLRVEIFFSRPSILHSSYVYQSIFAQNEQLSWVVCCTIEAKEKVWAFSDSLSLREGEKTPQLSKVFHLA